MIPSPPLALRGADEVASLLDERRRLATDAWRDIAEALGDAALSHRVDAAGAALIAALAGGHTLLVAGNGGSAAMSGHVAAEFLGRCVRDRAPLPALNLAESMAGITAIGNDFGYDEVFVRGIAAHGRAGDVLLALSTSGASRSVLAALDAARDKGMVTILLTGAHGGASCAAEYVLAAPSKETPRIQEVHLMWAHAWCEAVDLLCDPAGGR